jgi:hypothetical protein
MQGASPDQQEGLTKAYSSYLKKNRSENSKSTELSMMDNPE